MADVSMLVTDTEYGPYPYAGVPWFSTAFGRDGIITAMQMLWLYPGAGARGAAAISPRPGADEDPTRDAEPGKILHETRKCELAVLGEVPFGCYYGSIDSTPLFVALAGQYWQYTADSATLDAIWPNVKAALAWIDRLRRCGWRRLRGIPQAPDTGLGEPGLERFRRCRVPCRRTPRRTRRSPCAKCRDTSTWRARSPRAWPKRAAIRLAERLSEQARLLREKFEAQFWDDELDMYVLALDGDKQSCRVRTSNAGQVLFTGIASADRAATWRRR